MDSKLLRREWTVVIAGAAILAASIPADILLFPEESAREAHTPISVFAGILAMLGHAMWISMDRMRRGREVGAWRFGAIFLGPLAVMLYLGLEYRLRGLVFIAAYVAILVGSVLAGIAAAYLLLRARGVA